MAKLIGNMQFSGRLRNDVGLRGQDGEVYLRANTKPSNPNTEQQQAVRSKFNLAAQFSKITPAEVIAGLAGGTKRKRRARYSSLIINNAQEQQYNNENFSYLEPASLVLSEGTLLNLKEEATTRYNTEDKSFEVTIPIGNFKDSANPNGVMDGALVVAVMSSNESGTNVYTGMQQVLASRENNKPKFPGGTNTGAQIYIIPITAASEKARAKYIDAIQKGTTDNDYYAALYYRLVSSSDFKYHQSLYIASVGQ